MFRLLSEFCYTRDSTFKTYSIKCKAAKPLRGTGEGTKKEPDNADS